MIGKRSAIWAAAAALLTVLPAWGQGDPEMEEFRAELIRYVRDLEGMPVTLLESIYEDPRSLIEARQGIEDLTHEELREVREALDLVPHWRSLPALITTTIPTDQFYSPLELAATLDLNRQLLGSPQSRDDLLRFVDQLDTLRAGLPPSAVSERFGPRVASLRASIEGLSSDELVVLRQAFDARAPMWAARVRSSRQARMDGASYSRADCNISDNCGSGESFPNNIICEIENIIDEIVAIPCRVGEFAQDAGDFILEQLEKLLTFLEGLLPSKQEIEQALVSGLNSIFSSMRQRPHDWPLDVFPGQRQAMRDRGIDPARVDPVLAIPCPNGDFGTDAIYDPGSLTDDAEDLFFLGKWGTREAAIRCERRIKFLPKAIAEFFPDDVTSIKVKIAITIAQFFIWGIDYFCLCFEAAAEVRFDDVQQVHRELVSSSFCDEEIDFDRDADPNSLTEQQKQTLEDCYTDPSIDDMIKLSTIATKAGVAGVSSKVGEIQVELDQIGVNLFDLRADIANLDDDVAMVDTQAQGLLDSAGEAAAALQDFQDLALQLRIEADLVRNGDDRVALFQLPSSVGGLIEEVAAILEGLIDDRAALGRDVDNARLFLQRGEYLYLEGSYKKAYSEYRRAYRELVLTR